MHPILSPDRTKSIYVRTISSDIHNGSHNTTDVRIKEEGGPPMPASTHLLFQEKSFLFLLWLLLLLLAAVLGNSERGQVRWIGDGGSRRDDTLLFFFWVYSRKCNPKLGKISPKKIYRQFFAKIFLFSLVYGKWRRYQATFLCILKVFRRLKLLSKSFCFRCGKEWLFQNLSGRIRVRFSLRVNDLFLVWSHCVCSCSIHSKASSLCREGL